MNSGNGNFLMKMIYLCMDLLMHNPKRALIILFVIFIATMITGELIGTVRNAEIPFSPPAEASVSGRSGDYFLLPEIIDLGAVHLTPGFEITMTPNPTIKPEIDSAGELTLVETHPEICVSDLNLSTGTIAGIDFPGGYSADVRVRYRPDDPNIIIGIVRSGDNVYLLEGPVCKSGTRWWKINSDTHKIVGWIPEKIESKPIIRLK